MHSADPLLAAESLSLERGGRELFRNLSFEAHPGHLYQVVGANRARMPSRMHVLAGLSHY